MTNLKIDGDKSMPAWTHGEQWKTIRSHKSVLVAVHTITYAHRLMEVASLLASDTRIQLSFTIPPHPFNSGTVGYLYQLGIVPIPWAYAINAPFDLALATGSRGIEKVHAPVLRFPHGAGHNKPLRKEESVATERRPVGMLSREYLVKNGRVLPAALALAHERDLESLASSCPEALPVATVVGDPCHDRIVASRGHREEYRRALGIAEDEKLIVVASTWGTASTFDRLKDCLPELLADLPESRYRIAVLVHPNVWAGHGEWQVRNWLAGRTRRNFAIVPPAQEWEALLIAANVIIGDHGSITCYGVLTQSAILLTTDSQREVAIDSPADTLAALAPEFDPLRPLEEQLLSAAKAYRADQYQRVTELFTSASGLFHGRMRGLMYRMLELPEPTIPPSVPVSQRPPALSTWQPGV